MSIVVCNCIFFFQFVFYVPSKEDWTIVTTLNFIIKLESSYACFFFLQLNAFVFIAFRILAGSVLK